MIVDQLFTPKPLKEGGPYDLPGKDYDRPGDTPRKRPSGEQNPYPYSKEQDDDYFREIFRKKREAAKKAEQSKLAESMLMEDPIYRNFKGIGRYIAERKLTEPEILQVFADAEAGMTDKATGANRTFLGRGKDTTMDFAGGVADALKGVWSGIQNSVPVAAVDVAYDQATDALANLTGGQKGAVMQAIKKYRNLAKQYPKTAGLSKAALVAIAGLATGGAGLPAVAALVYGLDSSIKGEKLSDIALKAGGAAATAWAAGKLFGGGATQPGPTDSVAGLVDPTPDLATYTVQSGDTLSQIAQANNTSVQELIGLNPQLAADSGAVGGQSLNPDVIFPGQEITLPPGTPGTDVYAGGVGTNSNTMADIAKGQVPDSSISQGMAAKGQAAAGGNQFDLPTADAAQNAAVDAQVRADYADAGPAEKAEILKTTGMTADQLTQLDSPKIDYSQPGPVSTDSLGQKLEYGMPVNDKGSFVPPNSGLPAEELAKQTAAYNSWKADFMKRFPEATLRPDGTMQPFKSGLAPIFPGMTPKTFESVKLRVLPANKLIDQKATVLNWALNESVGRKSHSVNLTAVGTYTVFENVDCYRLALLEYVGTQPGRPELPDQYRPDMPDGAGVQSKPGLFGRGLNALDRGVKKVGGALSNFGHQFTTGVTKEKLKMNWHQAGKPSDSDQLAAWLAKQGVPQEVVTGVYSKMSIPYTAPAAQPDAQPADQPDAQATAPTTGTAQRLMPFNNINPKTGQRWTVDDMEARRAERSAPAATNTAATNTAAPAATNTAPVPSATKTTAGNLPGFNASNVMNLPGMEKYAKKPATPPAKTPNFAGPTGYGKITQSFKTPGAVAPMPAPTGTKVTTGGATPDEKAKLDQRIAQALKQPVAEMLQMVETKEDVQKIKQFVDQTFTRYGAVNESAFAVRNQILEHVTQVGAQRRREHSQQVAH
jgi:LysM repeat protein